MSSAAIAKGVVARRRQKQPDALRVKEKVWRYKESSCYHLVTETILQAAKKVYEPYDQAWLPETRLSATHAKVKGASTIPKIDAGNVKVNASPKSAKS